MDKAAAPRSSLGTAPSGVPALPTAFAAKHPRLVRGQRCALPTALTCHQVFKKFLFWTAKQPNSQEQPPYRPRLGRSRTAGAAPPRPPGLRPLWPPGHGPRLVPTTGRQGEAAQAEGRRAVWLLGEISKKWAVRMHGGGFRGACPPVQWSGGQAVNGRWAVRVQPQAVPAVHGP